MPQVLKSYVGQRIGSRVVTEILPPNNPRTARRVRWRCDCGFTGDSFAPSFRTTVCCTKCRDKDASVRAKTHGDTGTKLWISWNNMRRRCAGTHDQKSRKWYFLRGITVCDEWSTYEAFRDWALSHGYQENLTLDRIFSCRGYSPDNCEWVTRGENTRRAKEDVWRRYDTTPIEMLWGAC